MFRTEEFWQEFFKRQLKQQDSGLPFMASAETEKNGPDKTAPKSKAAEFADTFESLITALILAFVFITFVMEAFRIPTGSMADTLKGAHFRMRCLQCGYKYEHGFVPQDYGMPQDTVPSGQVTAPRTRCPSCGYEQSIAEPVSVANGDRILVLKWPYQFFEPKRWDVVVFKNPLEPTINYIKRLIGRPGEAVEIIDGDIYINGKICRKPPKVQDEMWMPVYDNDYQPVRPEAPSFNGKKWQQPFNVTSSEWKINGDSPTLFRIDSPAGQVSEMTYDALIGNNFRGNYAYNEVDRYGTMPYCSDLMVRFYVEPDSSKGSIGIELSKYQTHYRAWIELSGEMIIAKILGDEEKIVVRNPIGQPVINKAILTKFAIVDHQLVFEFGNEKVSCDLGREPNSAGPRKTEIQPVVKIFGSGNLTVSHTAIFRDVHYTSANGPLRGRATEGNALKLEEDEFFVLGDNSPNSEDGRWWSQQGRGNNGVYRAGIVPRDYLVGKALFVYWPGGFKLPWPQELKTFLAKNGERNFLFRIMQAVASFNCVPDVGQMHLIYNGSSKTE